MLDLEWIKAPDTENTYGIYVTGCGAKYPLAVIEFGPALGASDLERLLRTAPEACEAMMDELNSGQYAGLQMPDGFWVAYDQMADVVFGKRESRGSVE